MIVVNWYDYHWTFFWTKFPLCTKENNAFQIFLRIDLNYFWSECSSRSKLQLGGCPQNTIFEDSVWDYSESRVRTDRMCNAMMNSKLEHEDQVFYLDEAFYSNFPLYIILRNWIQHAKTKTKCSRYHNSVPMHPCATSTIVAMDKGIFEV